MTKYYKRENFAGTANKEVLKEIVTSTAEEVKHVTAIWFTESGGTLYHDAILRAYVERERILDMRYTNLTESDDKDGRMIHPRIAVDIDLPVGQSLSVGFVSGGTASTFDITAEYELT